MKCNDEMREMEREREEEGDRGREHHSKVKYDLIQIKLLLPYQGGSSF